MATTHPLPSAASGGTNHPVLSSGDETVESRALVAVSAPDQPPCDPAIFSAPIALLPVELDVTVPVRKFRVRNLLALEPGQLIESQWGHGEDVPLASGEVQLAWTEFEVIETQLAVRVTRLA
ncbi:MAG TPA: FliM/FliN family flagellar motor C-terminal domain-containing protein [Terracidiphilus sp.]|jgi:flagellar motor switch protein FliN/FliY|nr:FliM/FliN family flagellar motor C-terminal domain-containing protein [Terracidiphilus sp.]